MSHTEILALHDSFKDSPVRITRQVQFDLAEGEHLEGVCLAVVQGSYRPLAICDVTYRGKRYVTDFDATALKVMPSLAPDTLLYFESHVTIEPVFGARRDEAAEIGRRHRFKLANLMMQKREEETPERSMFDTFMTGHGQEKADIYARTMAVVEDLRRSGFKVWRYKVEDTLLDSRDDDIWNLLDPRPLTDAQRRILIRVTGVETECRVRPSDPEFANYDYLRRAGYLEITVQERSPNGFLYYVATEQGRAVHGG